MDFFARQDLARRKTKWLVGYFVAAVLLLMATVYLVALVLFAGIRSHHYGRYHHYDTAADTTPLHLWNPEIFLWSSLGVLAVVGLGSAYKISELAAGGSAVAELMGGRPISPATSETNERKLLNVVEEMSIASGVPMPKVYVMDDEPGINAFAAGHSASDAAVAVSRGCMELLTRDELQGVIGHEFSHILNGDMKLNLQLMGIIFGLLCLATIGRILMYVRSDNGRERNNALPILGIGLMVLGAAGAFFGRLIQAAVSRQREFLADASAVQFTRNPAGLSGALQKIGGYQLGSRLNSEHAPDLCHMFFSNGMSSSLFEPLATHPPLEERIKAIDPNWDGEFKPLVLPERAAEEFGQAPPPPFSNVLEKILDASDATAGKTIPAGTVMPNLGTPNPGHLEYAEKLRHSLPPALQAAAREPVGAVALIYALLLSPDPAVRLPQLDELAEGIEGDIYEALENLYPTVAQVATNARLPIVNLALGGLRGLEAEQYVEFAQTLDWLTKSDGQIDLFEFVLQKIILRHLSPQFGYGRKTKVQFYALKPLLPDCAIVLSALARVGSGVEAEVQRAFDCGRASLPVPEAPELTLLPPAHCGVTEIDPALNRLAVAAPGIKKDLLAACVQVVGADGVILETEAELLRAIADTLDCPMPPFIAT